MQESLCKTCNNIFDFPKCCEENLEDSLKVKPIINCRNYCKCGLFLKKEGVKMENLVTIEEFKEQVWNTEGVKIDIKLKEGAIEHLVRPYNYEKLPDNATVDDLKKRINECINEPFCGEEHI